VRSKPDPSADDRVVLAHILAALEALTRGQRQLATEHVASARRALSEAK